MEYLSCTEIGDSGRENLNSMRQWLNLEEKHSTFEKRLYTMYRKRKMSKSPCGSVIVWNGDFGNSIISDFEMEMNESWV